jgi:DNA-binding transcriptional LysR family regulator
MDSITNLRTFLTVVNCSGFSEAARFMNVVPSVVAKRIAQLELAMGARLFKRTTRSVALTDAGQRLHVRALAVVSEFDDLASVVRRDESRLEGHLRLMLPTTLTLLYLGDVVSRFLADNDRVTAEVALADRSINPLEEAFDVVVSGRTARYEGVTQIPLAPIHYVLCGSTEYLTRFSTPAHPHDLAAHRCLVFNPAGRTWSFNSQHGPILIDVPARLVADDAHSLLLAAQQGLGLAILPGYLAKTSLERGELLPLLPDHPVTEAWFKAFVPRRVERLALVRAMCDRLRQALAELSQADIVSKGTLRRGRRDPM